MQSVTEGLEVSDMIKRILSGCLVIGIVAAMIGFQFIFPYSLNIIMALITAIPVYHFHAGFYHISLQKGQVSGYLCGIRHDIVGYNRIEYSISDEILKSTALYAVCGNGVVCRMDCRCGSIFCGKLYRKA